MKDVRLRSQRRLDLVAREMTFASRLEVAKRDAQEKSTFSGKHGDVAIPHAGRLGDMGKSEKKHVPDTNSKIDQM